MICRSCHLDKCLDELSIDVRRSSGHSNICKLCDAKRSRLYHRDAYSVDKERTRKAKYYIENRTQMLQRDKEISGSPKDKARKAVVVAVLAGVLVKPTRCEHCGKDTPSRRLHGHHADYSQPLSVKWLCTTCHGLEHRKAS